MDQEWDALKQLVGVDSVDGHPTTAGKHGIPDGGYLFVVTFSDAKGNPVKVTLQLPPGYGNGAVPVRTVRRNGITENYPAVEPIEWRRAPKLTNLVEEVRRTYT